MYLYAVKKRHVKENIMLYVENIQYERRERDYLTEQELYQFFEEIDHAIVKVGVMTMAYSGLRISELLALRLEDVNFERKRMLVLGKGRKERFVPLSDRLIELLQHYVAHVRPQRGDYLMATSKTGRLSSQYVNKIIREAANRCDFHKRVTAHTMRHSFASHLIKNQVNLAILQRLLGHSNIRTTSIYLHVEDQAMHSAVNKW